MIDAGLRDVTARVRQILAASPHTELRGLQVEQHGNRFFLRGNVGTFYAKQMAQETVRCAVRGLRLVNNVSVD
jgi:osmotically-inducible protein OsmY